MFLLQTACAPAEENFKSKVPISIPKNSQALSSSASTLPLPVSEETVVAIPEQINLAVPFFSQAPDGDWSYPWQEACEEASVILAYFYSTNQELTKTQFKEQIQVLVAYQNKTFGNYEHTSIEQTVQMVRESLGYQEIQILDNPTIEEIKKELAQGHAIVAPFAGKELKNPFYTNGGPVYHMMVIKGYDENHFITNDVGTKRGADFIYPQERIMEALHDWHDADINQGRKRVIVFD